MKRIIIFIGLVFVLKTAYSQQTEGFVRYISTHNWVQKMKTTPFVSVQEKERMAYVWGKNSSWRIAQDLYFTSEKSRYVDSEEQIEERDFGYSDRKELYDVNHDYTHGTMRDGMEYNQKKYWIEDSIKVPTWQVMNELKEIAGHLCMKAVTYDSVKIQTVVAWFALDIPVSAGPERYCGLPGLILELDYNDGALVVTASQVTFRKVTDEELKPTKTKKTTVIKETDYQKMLKEYMDKAKEAQRFPWGMRYG